MEDDWGLHAVVRGCCSALSAATSASSSATSSTTTTSPFMADFQPLTNHRHNNHNNSFLFSSTFGNIVGQSVPSASSSSGYGQGQLFSLSPPSSSSSDLVTAMRPSTRSSHGHEDLHELYKPFFPKSESANCVNNILSQSHQTNNGSIIVSSFARTANNNSLSDQRSVQQQMKHNNNSLSSLNAKPLSHGSASATTPRSKKRKNQLKKVCQVPAESLSSDIWAWRKYGQKPIKGSPYPRGYYRCSSSKGCLARKQVERNRSDPGMFIVTYTAEHNHPAPTHRNSLAGSTRQKQSLSSGDPAKPSKPSSPATSPEDDPAAAAQAQSGSATESKEGPESSAALMDDDEDDDEFGFSDMAVSDDFFVGLEGIGSPAAGEFLSDHFPAGFGMPWSASSAATAAGGS